jgi:hypothetical protein
VAAILNLEVMAKAEEKETAKGASLFPTRLKRNLTIRKIRISYKPGRSIGQSCGVIEITRAALEFLASSKIRDYCGLLHMS